MRLILLSDAFPPLRSSAAVQMLDLSRELASQGHSVHIVVASPEIASPWQLDFINGCHLLRIKTLHAKDKGRFIRALAESMMPFMMWWRWRQCPWSQLKWDGVVWYSPTIFLGMMVHLLRRSANTPSYLILRDIFPEWAADMQILRRGLVFKYFQFIARFQYRQADVIGLQSPGNLTYFMDQSRRKPNSIEVLHNWLTDRPLNGCRIQVSQTHLAGRRIVVYAGNMGIAQDMDILMNLATQMINTTSVGFLFVGRGTEVLHLQQRATVALLSNVMFCDEVEPDEIPSLYAQCEIGLLALDSRHKTHNIPGKFISYMEAGLPVLASVNESNDIVSLIREYDVGRVSTANTTESLAHLLNEMLELNSAQEFKTRCTDLHRQLFSVSTAAHQIIESLARVSKC